MTIPLDDILDDENLHIPWGGIGPCEICAGTYCHCVGCGYEPCDCRCTPKAPLAGPRDATEIR